MRNNVQVRRKCLKLVKKANKNLYRREMNLFRKKNNISILTPKNFNFKRRIKLFCPFFLYFNLSYGYLHFTLVIYIFCK